MYRLRFRKSIIGFLLLIGGAFGLTFLRLNPFNSSTNFDLPLLYILPGQILLPLLFALFQYKACPIIQKLGAIFSTFALVFFFGLVGNISAEPLAFIQKDLLLHFNAIQISVINLFALMVAANLMNVEKISSYADTKAAEAELGRLKQAKVDPETQAKWEKAASHADRQAEGRSLRSTMTNLKAITLTEPGQELRPQLQETPAAKAQPTPSPTGEEVGGLAGLLDRIGEAPEAVPGEDFAEASHVLESSGEFSLAGALEQQEAAEIATEAQEEASSTELKEEPSKVEPAQPTMSGFKTTSQAKGPSETADTSSQQLPAVQAPPEKPVQPSATANRLAAMKRRNTSTFTKLQSLSASSADSLQQAPLVESGSDDGLKSLLDRLDDGKVEEPPQPLSPPREIILDYLFQDETQTAPSEEEKAQEAQATHSSLSQRLSGLAETAGQTTDTPVEIDTTPEVEAVSTEVAAAPEVEAVSTEIAAAPEVEAVSTEVTAPPEVEAVSTEIAAAPEVEAVSTEVTAAPEIEAVSTEIAAAPESTQEPEIISLEPEVSEVEAVATEIPAASVMDATVTQEPEVLTPEEIEAATFVSTQEEKASTEEDAAVLFEGGVDKEIDDIFQTIAPPEAQKEVGQPEVAETLSESTVEATLEVVTEQALEVLVKGEVETTPTAEAEPTLFMGGVDKDIDDIFSNLAPPEAQKTVAQLEATEVVLEAVAVTATELAGAEAAETEPTLFMGGVDKDIDDIFSNLAPPEAQKTVGQPEVTEAVVEAVTAQATELAAGAEAVETEPTLFMGGVDKDIDDIFSNLAPPEAQKTVGQPEVTEAVVEAVTAPATELAAGAEAVETEPTLFMGGVDKDIDDIFSNLAPPEAQKVVGQPEATAQVLEVVAVPESAAAPTAETEPTLFTGGVDKDIDDIFSNLAPPEAQKEVVSLDLDIFANLDTSASVADAAKLLETPVAEVQAAESVAQPISGGLFTGGVDSDIDSIFSNLAPPEAQKEITHAKPVVTSQEAGSTGIFSNALGEDIDNIFSGLTDSTQLDVTPETLSKFKADEQPTPSSNQAPGEALPVAPAASSPKSTGDMPAVSQEMAKEILKTGTEIKPSAAQVPGGETATQFKEVKEFGRLSSRSAATPKAAGESVGAMKTIGKLLLDVQAVENIIKAGETKKIGAGLSTAKIISAARGEGIKNILTTIDTYEGVSGSLIVGHDGLVISSTVGSGWDKDMLGALSTALLSTSNLATKKLEIGKLRQMVLLTNHGEGSEQTLKATLLTDVEVGILAVFVENAQVEKLDGLLDTIQKAVHGG